MSQKVATFFDEMETWFPGEGMFFSKSKRYKYSPIISNGESYQDYEDSEKGIWRYSSTRRLLENIFEAHIDNIRL